MTDPSDSITLTREQLEREFINWLAERGGPLLGIGEHDDLRRLALAQSFMLDLFTNAKAREEATQ